MRLQTKDVTEKWNLAKPTSRSSIISSIVQGHIAYSLSQRSTIEIQSESFSVCIDERTEVIEDKTKEMTRSNQQVNGWISFIGEELYNEPSVESVHVTIDEGTVDFWIVIPKWDIEVVRRIAKNQARIMDILGVTEKPTSLIDFHVIYRNGHKEKDLVPTRAIQLPKQT